MKIREVEQRAERLIEQGEHAKSQLESWESQQAMAQAELLAAYDELSCASETDEDGYPYGDVQAAQSRVNAASARLANCEAQVARWQDELQRIDGAKQSVIGEAERYVEGEERNLEVTRQLTSRMAGDNISPYISNLIARMDVGEDIRYRLHQSLGQSYSRQSFSGGGGGSSGLGGGAVNRLNGGAAALGGMAAAGMREKRQRFSAYCGHSRQKFAEHAESLFDETKSVSGMKKGGNGTVHIPLSTEERLQKLDAAHSAAITEDLNMMNRSGLSGDKETLAGFKQHVGGMNAVRDGVHARILAEGSGAADNSGGRGGRMDAQTAQVGTEASADAHWESTRYKELSYRVRNPKLPKEGGEWGGARGDSRFTPDDNALFTHRKNGIHIQRGSRLKQTMREIGGQDYVEYRNGEPDFTPFMDRRVGPVKLEENISLQRDGAEGTFRQAEIDTMRRWSKRDGKEYSPEDVQRYMSEHKLTWHECSDLKTVLAVPTEIHAAFGHTGGTSHIVNITAMREIWNERAGGMVRYARGSGRYRGERGALVRAEKGLRKMWATRAAEIKKR